MGDLLTFAPRPKPAAPPPASEPLTDEALRARIEEAAEVAVDTAERLIALLDGMDGDADLEDGADAEPSLAAPENHHASQVGWCRGGDADREGEAPEAALPETALPALAPDPAAAPEPREAEILAWPLPWSGRGNVITVAAGALLDLMERRG